MSYEGEPILLGPINRAGLEKTPHQSWFSAGYSEYGPDMATLQSVAGKLNDVEIIIFMGTWCEDSQREVPHFFRILDELKYGRPIAMYAVDNHPDRYKMAPGGEEKKFNVEYVPAFLFFKDGKEIGRIIEFPNETLEKDMEAILN